MGPSRIAASLLFALAVASRVSRVALVANHCVHDTSGNTEHTMHGKADGKECFRPSAHANISTAREGLFSSLASLIHDHYPDKTHSLVDQLADMAFCSMIEFGGEPTRVAAAVVDKGMQGCTARRPCTLCEGDCDEDEDCVGDLKCFHRWNALDVVPGCASFGYKGGVIANHDYCWSPAAATSAPTPTNDESRQEHGQGHRHGLRVGAQASFQDRIENMVILGHMAHDVNIVKWFADHHINGLEADLTFDLVGGEPTPSMFYHGGLCDCTCQQKQHQLQTQDMGGSVCKQLWEAYVRLLSRARMLVEAADPPPTHTHTHTHIRVRRRVLVTHTYASIPVKRMCVCVCVRGYM